MQFLSEFRVNCDVGCYVAQISDRDSPRLNLRDSLRTSMVRGLEQDSSIDTTGDVHLEVTLGGVKSGDSTGMRSFV